MLVFRHPADGAESDAAAKLVGSPSTRDAVTYVLAEVASVRPAVAAAVTVRPAGRLWRVDAVGGAPCHLDRLATELVRAATAAGAVRLGAAPDAPCPVRALFGKCLSGGKPVAGWLAVDL